MGKKLLVVLIVLAALLIGGGLTGYYTFGTAYDKVSPGDAIIPRVEGSRPLVFVHGYIVPGTERIAQGSWCAYIEAIDYAYEDMGYIKPAGWSALCDSYLTAVDAAGDTVTTPGMLPSSAASAYTPPASDWSLAPAEPWPKNTVVAASYYTTSATRTISTGHSRTGIATYFPGWFSTSVVHSYSPLSDRPGIPVYAERLMAAVEKVKEKTGEDKVDIVAHSMGGLVSRYYIQELGGADSVNMLIIVGTPNSGIDSARVNHICPTMLTECQQMQAGSNFMTALGNAAHAGVTHITIAGDVGDTDSKGANDDGLVEVDSVFLNGAEDNYVLAGYNHEYQIWSPYHPDMTQYNIIRDELSVNRRWWALELVYSWLNR